MTPVTISSHPRSGLISSSQYEALKPAAKQAETIPDASRPPSSTVTISGRAMLLSRLFNTDDPSAAPKVETSTTIANTSGSVYNFLTDDDKNTLSKLYEIANSEGTNLVEVDNVAFDLAHYRRAGPGGPIDTTGVLYDTKGQPIISEFNPNDEAVAQRVVTSKAMGDTLFDKGFLMSVFTPGKTPVHASNFSFLERAVYAFSASGYDGSTDPDAKSLVRPRKEDFEPLKLTPENLQAGHDVMLSRLFGGGSDDGSTSVSISSTKQLLDFLTEGDQDFLKKLYAGAQSRNEDLSKIDNIAVTIANYRMMSRWL
jgi:hypothetical protein